MSKEKTSILDITPVLENDVTINTGKDGVYTLSFPAIRRHSLLHFMSRWSKYKYMELDNYGTEVIKQIDGTRTVEEIIHNLSSSFIGQEDFAARIIMFISGLKQHGALKYVIPHKKKTIPQQ